MVIMRIKTIRNTSTEENKELTSSPRMLYQEDKAYWEAMNPYRKAYGLPPLPLGNLQVIDFSGTWKFNIAMSQTGNLGIGNVADIIKAEQEPDIIHLKKTTVVEWGDDKITLEDLPLDVTEMASTYPFN
jgi:hypothetical protein